MSDTDLPTGDESTEPAVVDTPTAAELVDNGQAAEELPADESDNSGDEDTTTE